MEIINAKADLPCKDPTLPPTTDPKQPIKCFPLGLPSALRPTNCRQERATAQQEQAAGPEDRGEPQGAGIRSSVWILKKGGEREVSVWISQDMDISPKHPELSI